MDVPAIKAAKSTMDAAIWAAVNTFEKATNVPVTSIQLTKNGAGFNINVTAVVTISV